MDNGFACICMNTLATISRDDVKDDKLRFGDV